MRASQRFRDTRTRLSVPSFKPIIRRIDCDFTFISRRISPKMPEPLPAQVVIAIATVIAALITGVIAVVNLTLSKEQKVSELRQAWIDGLRDDLAKFLSAVRAKAVALHDQRTGVVNAGDQESDFIEGALAERTAIAQESLYRLKLRLNPSEADHQELERLLDQVVKTYDDLRVPTELNVRKETSLAIDRVTAHARSVLKQEWKRVKVGEPAYVNLRNWLVPAIIGVTAMFVIVVYMSKIR